MSLKFSSPAQQKAVSKVLAALQYDGNTRIAITNNFTFVISNRTRIVEVKSNGEIHWDNDGDSRICYTVSDDAHSAST